MLFQPITQFISLDSHLGASRHETHIEGTGKQTFTQGAPAVDIIGYIQVDLDSDESTHLVFLAHPSASKLSPNSAQISSRSPRDSGM
jgi:hypothetical protein